MYGKKNDLIATPKFNQVMQEFKEGHLNNASRAQVTSASEAVSIGSSKTNQSYNQPKKDTVRNMSKTVIPSSGNVKHPGANQEYVKSGKGSKKEQEMTKNASIRHQNPEFFKKQSDRKNHDQFPFQIKEQSKGLKY